MKKIFLAVAISIIAFSGVHANEGMWLPLLIKRLNHVDMQKHGLQLTAEEIYSVNNSSLKDAIVRLGRGFCTGEMISSTGLMLTNHHCGFDAIQENSTPEHNYLADGFWAMTKAQEIAIPDFTVSYLHSMDDATATMLSGVTDEMDAQSRSKKISENKAAILKEEGDKYDVQIKSFFEGNEFYIFRYITYKDVRLVGAPPSSIGKFGGDTDNWMWPRHTGDFSMFRIYADKDNQPAEYSADNVPFQPKHHLPISLNGVKEGDYAMVMGYPGSTDRYLSSYGVKLAVEKEQPARVKIRRIKLDIMEEGQAKSEAVRIQYASKHARVSNYWKYFVGQSAQLVKNNVWDKKKKIEDDFDAWANKSEENKKKYGSVIATFDEAHKTLEKYVYGDVYLQEAVFGPDISGFVYGNFGRRATIMPALAEENTEAIQTAKEEIIAAGKEFFKNYNVEIDKNLFVAMMELYYNDVPKEFHPEKLTYYHNKCKGNWRKLADKYYSKSPFTSQEKLEDWLSDVDAKTIESDMVYQLMSDFINTYVQKILMPKGAAEGNMGTAKRLFIDGLRTMNADKVYAPDANSTMRITYGQVLAYDAKDGVTYKNQTTLDGVMEKDANTNDVFHEFYVHDKLKELYKAKDYGQYGEDGVLYVGFLSNNDITGGNSGSPVINGNGELIGCAFDGNWEAMSGDIYFEPNIQRTISVDIRYVLFVVDKYAGAGHLVEEMTLVKGPKKPLKKKVVAPKEVQMLAPQH
jgi:hypothetical protein